MLLKYTLQKIVGSKHDREVKKLLPNVEKILRFEPAFRKLSDRDLQAKTVEFKQKLSQGATLDDILPEAFAACREASSRVLGMRHFDVQLIGGMALHRGKIAEMKTGEGKTLVATLPCYLNGLSGKGVHVITVNDYLAKRDAEWMGRVHRFMGLDVGTIVHGLTDAQRKKNYGADVTYGTNNEFGFDYLRDNMKPSLDAYVQREHNFAIVDEVDSILIDEARTPLIISGPADEEPELYYVADKAVRHLKKDVDYTLDEKHRSVTLTEDGVLKVEQLLKIENLYAPENFALVHHVHAALRAHSVFRKDVDYVVREGEIVIVDEFTGRLMPGRRWSDGLHQAIEAKEGVTLEAENQTLATITLQNYFRLYKKLAGMTGTADTEAEEFKKIYNLGVLVVPTNKPMVRSDFNDLVYRNEAGKYRAVVQDIIEKNKAGRPVLVGTVSVAKSERVASLLRRAGVAHNVLNAKNHESEAEIIASAGQRSMVTIATNMAGRGTDIILGAGVKDIGGLHVIATERHESRRIDNQLRGRAGRQGDPGSSQFYLSLEDDLMRIFASDRVIAIMDRLGMEEDVPISDRLVSKSIANAQKRVELHHFDQREHLLKYDDVLNKQREVIYSMRRLVLEGAGTKGLVGELSKEFSNDLAQQFSPDASMGRDHWDFEKLREALVSNVGLQFSDEEWKKFSHAEDAKLADVAKWISVQAAKRYENREKEFGEETMRELERYFFIQSLDHQWKDHLLALDHLKEGIHLRGYAQKDPLVEYRREGFALFKMLDRAIRQNALSRLYTVRLMTKQEREEQQRREEEAQQRMLESAQMSGPALDSGGSPDPASAQNLERGAPMDPLPTEDSRVGSVDAAKSAASNFLRQYQEQRMKQLEKAQASGDGTLPQETKKTPIKTQDKIGRNDPCFCGSGKKYKHCHGKGE
ncbi:MAG: preprotein translocase subunit SecA [Proteobacteria bacterium]|nr:preprotein translocase subunit SecA [Pseudomonadota bacterium]